MTILILFPFFVKYLELSCNGNTYDGQDFHRYYAIYSEIFYCMTGICETGYKGDNCDQCDIGYYGDGIICSTCGTHKTTPKNSTALSVSHCMYHLMQLL